MVLDVENLGFAPDLVDYDQALARQHRVHDEVVDGSRPDALLLVEHPPVYTAGRRARPEEHPWDGTPVVPVGRGGKVTYHGPGMLVGYPILRLSVPVDAVRYVRELERAVVHLVSGFGVRAVTVPGRTGVWVPADSRGPDRKIAAIGVQVSRRVTLHGFALNCSNDLRPFSRIVPCGIADASVTTLSLETGSRVDPREVAPRAAELLTARLPLLTGVSTAPA